MYDYREEVKNDIIERIREDYTTKEYVERIKNDRETFAEELNEKFWVDDAVTGNASGSYTFNTYKAEENLSHNMDLLKECADEFGGNVGEWVERGAEYCDVSIRCYLLAECIESALDELEDDDPDGLFELENEDGEKVYFETLEEIGDYIADDSKGFGHLRAFTLRGRLDTESDFDIMAERKYHEDFTRVYPNYHYMIAELNPNADELRGMTYIFTELCC